MVYQGSYFTVHELLLYVGSWLFIFGNEPKDLFPFKPGQLVRQSLMGSAPLPGL
jgi:hypothetical protein